MLREKGLIIICDRCRETLCITNSERKQYLGGLPDGWIHVHGTDLCPNCAASYARLIDDFYKNTDKK